MGSPLVETEFGRMFDRQGEIFLVCRTDRFAERIL
jgi:hypothetical protein